MVKEITDYYNNPIHFKKKPFLRGIGRKYLKNKYFNKWQEYLVNEYQPPKKYKICLFLPCAWGKPYSQSYIHYEIIKTLHSTGHYEDIHQIIVSNAGVIPREWENYYPFAAYDWDPNLEWKDIKKEYIKVLTERLVNFIDKHKDNYEHFLCYLRPDSESFKAIKNIETKFNLSILNSCKYEISSEELSQISVFGVYNDCDHVLLAKKNLQNLYKEISHIFESRP